MDNLLTNENKIYYPDSFFINLRPIGFEKKPTNNSINYF